MLKIRNEGVWFEFEGAKFKVRPLISSKIKALREKCVRKEVFYDRGRRVVNEVVDDEKFEHEVIDYLLESWEGVGDEQGNLLDVNLENKKKIFDVVAIRDFIWSSAQSLSVEDSEKN